MGCDQILLDRKLPLISLIDLITKVWIYSSLIEAIFIQNANVYLISPCGNNQIVKWK